MSCSSWKRVAEDDGGLRSIGETPTRGPVAAAACGGQHLLVLKTSGVSLQRLSHMSAHCISLHRDAVRYSQPWGITRIRLVLLYNVIHRASHSAVHRRPREYKARLPRSGLGPASSRDTLLLLYLEWSPYRLLKGFTPVNVSERSLTVSYLGPAIW